MSTKYIFVTGGVVSSLGKGLSCASIALLLEKKGLKVGMMKLDPYLNVDPGTMNPFEHGEVYVTDDGAETDLDLGHYHRFSHTELNKYSNITSGQIYETIIKKERKGEFLGKTVQVVPHITEEIKKRICIGAETNKADVMIVEVGGTVGDIESQPFLEAIRQFKQKFHQDCLNIHLSYIPYLKAAKELKTKPTQHSVQLLREIGIFPEILICRSEHALSNEIKQKISLFCNVPYEAVIEQVDVPFTIYEAPCFLHQQKLDEIICASLKLPFKPSDLKDWEQMIQIMKTPKKELCIGVVGKYMQHTDAYKSIFEALQHAATFHHISLNIKTFESDKFDHNKALDRKDLGECQGYLIPGGFGVRGWEGKIKVARLCREEKIPFLGICLGMQVLCVEFARHVVKLEGANSSEMDPFCLNPVISILENQKQDINLGGSMRLGAYDCHLTKGSLAYQAYQKDKISERHRHRYEFNNQYKEIFENQGLTVSGHYQNLCEIVELKEHPWMIGVQFHPEFKSKPLDPHPLFIDFLGACLKNG
ncbi:MAG: CTP synthase [Rhabdochlamydiaceae bacterium]